MKAPLCRKKPMELKAAGWSRAAGESKLYFQCKKCYAVVCRERSDIYKYKSNEDLKGEE